MGDVAVDGQPEEDGPSTYTRTNFLRTGAGAAAVLLAGSGRLSGLAYGATAGRDVAAETVTLLNWHTSTPKAGLGEGYIAAGRAYQKANPKVSVKFQAEPIADYVPYVTSAARAKKLPSNIALYPGLNHASLFPALEPLTHAQVAPLMPQLTGWLDVELKVGHTDKYAGLPFGGQGVVWYYNKALFASAGLDPSKPPTTFDEFATVCTTLRAKGIDPIGVSGKDGYITDFMLAAWTTQFFPTQEDVQAFALGQRRFTDPGVVASLQAIAQTYTSGWWGAGAMSKQFTDIENDFANGKVAMTCGIITDIVNWALWDAQLGKSKYGVFAAPLLESAKVAKSPVFFYPSILLGVSKDAKDPDAAFAFNKYLVSNQAQTIVLRNGGSFPNRLDVDIAGVTQSPGATAIKNLLKRSVKVDAITSWLNSAASGQSVPLLVPAVTSDGISGYVKQIDSLQSKG